MIYVNGVKNGEGSKKWNTAVLAIKRELHNVLGGIDTSALNRVYSLFVNAYNRCVRLLKEMDARYGSFIPPYNNYYDELPIEELVDSDNFTAKLSLVLTEFDKLPKFNVPLVNLNNSIDSYNSSWLDFERTYVTKANNSLESVRKQVNDRGEHLGAVQAYAQKMSRYATEEQRTIAEEAANRVLSEVLTVTAGENAESLGAIEDSMINNETPEETREQVSEGKEQSESIAKTEDPEEKRDKMQEYNDSVNKYNEAAEKAKGAAQDYNQANALTEDWENARSKYNEAVDGETSLSYGFRGADGTVYTLEYDGEGNVSLVEGPEATPTNVYTGADAINKFQELGDDLAKNSEEKREAFNEAADEADAAEKEMNDKAKGAGIDTSDTSETETSETP